MNRYLLGKEQENYMESWGESKAFRVKKRKEMDYDLFQKIRRSRKEWR